MDYRFEKGMCLMKDELVQELSERLQDLLVTAGPVKEDSVPRAVQCVGGKLHIPLTEDLCYCGWEWSLNGVPADLEALELGTEEQVRYWCSRCVSGC